MLDFSIFLIEVERNGNVEWPSSFKLLIRAMSYSIITIVKGIFVGICICNTPYFITK